MTERHVQNPSRAESLPVLHSFVRHRVPLRIDDAAARVRAMAGKLSATLARRVSVSSSPRVGDLA